MKVLTFSTAFPKGHPKAGQPTFFVEKIWNSLRNSSLSLPYDVAKLAEKFPFTKDEYLQACQRIKTIGSKHHTIRAGSRWKAGDMASLRIWSGKPRRSKQIEFAQVEVKKVWDFELRPIRVHDARPIEIYGFINKELVTETQAKQLANNDGLTVKDFDSWFCPDGTKFILSLPIFTGQIICWSDKVNYDSLTSKVNK